jgi:hypothetical protein
MKLARIVVAVIGAHTALAGCNQRDQPSAPVPAPTVPGLGSEVPRPDHVVGGNLVPKVFEFPRGHAAEIRRAFSSGTFSYPVAVVSAQGMQTQFVHPKPAFAGDDRFAVSVPAQYHAAIEQWLQTMSKSAIAASRFEVTYWVVEAITGPETQVAPDLGEIEATLKGLAGLGKRRFKSVDQVSVRVSDDSDTKLKGRIIDASQKLANVGEVVELEVRLRLVGLWPDRPDQGPSVETTLLVDPNKPVVLGDAAQPASSDGVANLLLYVVRVRRVD